MTLYEIMTGGLSLSSSDTNAAPKKTCEATQYMGDFDTSFELLNGDGDLVSDADVFTEPSLVYFGYTSCPDVCPLDVDRNAHAVEILEMQGQSVTPVFITVDPKRDTPEVVQDFASSMHPKMIGLTGSSAQISAASKSFRTYYKAHPPTSGEYLVDHSTFTYLVVPGEGVAEFFRRDASPEEVAEKVSCLIEDR
ncbi:SCO family protein [Sulfitobacter sp. R18_1]|nr:SCO family protein [Sulfitobacter sp. R18_1]